MERWGLILSQVGPNHIGILFDLFGGAVSYFASEIKDYYALC